MNRAAFAAAAALVTWSEWARASLIEDYSIDGGKIHVLAPGAAAAYFGIGAARAGTRRSGRVKVLFVGGDFDRKGGPVLLDSIADLLTDRCELHVVTSKPLEPRPNLHVHTGLAPNSPALLQLFADADLFVLPSHAECLAVVLMEATAAGLPVITTDVGALGEAVQAGASGLIVQPGDRAALHQALEALIDDPARRERMGRAGFALAQRKFNAQRNNDALLDLVVGHANTAIAPRRAA